MERIIRSVIIISASLIGSLLFLLGVKQIRINKNRKPRFFIVTLLIALILAEYGIINSVNGEGKGAFFSLKSSKKQNKKKQSDRIIALNDTQEWKSFKAFWQELDQIVPKEKKDGEREYSHSMGEYFNAITSERADDLRRRLEELIAGLKKLEQDSKLSSIEIELLGKICTERIKGMSFGFFSIVSRMMPLPLQIDKEGFIKDLEQKIDVLIDLKKKRKIDQGEFQQAISNIYDVIQSFSIIDTISTHYVRYYYYPEIGDEKTADMLNIEEKYIAEIEKQYADYQVKKEQGKIEESDINYTGIDIKYKETKQAIEKVKEILPFLRELVVDLEK